jgi:hypothetical protein
MKQQEQGYNDGLLLVTIEAIDHLSIVCASIFRILYT